MTLAVGLWERTLAPADHDIHATARERLRASYEMSRSYVELAAAEISRDQPNYTVHDITHVDGLWEMADLIAGPEYALSPLEAYVLGCAMMIHDLAMGSAAYPSGIAALIGKERWRDTVYLHFQQDFGRPPSQAELDDPPGGIVMSAQRELLRELHAEQAARLPHQAFQDQDKDIAYFLISDSDLRNTFGDVIGRIAASHWWDVTKVADEFDTKFGAPAAFPREWTIDPLKLACLLRVADASHLDARRAPGFLRAIRSVDEESRIYWIFQERLNRPWLDVDRLTYTAQQPFTAADSDAWWLCVDTLRMVDRELRAVDITLADLGRPRFAARSVAYVDDLKRLARLIPVRDWYPVDARIQVSDVIDLVRKFGGKQLYGNDYEAAIRELISNGADAIRARRALMDQRTDEELRLRVQVEIRGDQNDASLIVKDNGIGMSREVLGGPLLDFGKSYWGSDAARREFPGLVSSGFQPTGQFGIGFFAVFMLGQHVEVISRRFDLGVTETNVLTFNAGLGSRPLLRRGLPEESLPFGGTQIAIKLDDDVLQHFVSNRFSLAEVCSQLCPTADFDLDVISWDGIVAKIITANDWKDCAAELLLSRIKESPRNFDRRIQEGADESLPKRLRLLTGQDGEALGRAALLLRPAGAAERSSYLDGGMVTSGGMRSATKLQHIGGVLLGEAQRAARDYAIPIVDQEALANWASEQAQILSEYEITPDQQLQLCWVIAALGGDTRDLILVEAKVGYLRSREITSWATDLDVVRLYQDAAFSLSGIRREDLRPDVLVIGMGIPGMLYGLAAAPSMGLDWILPTDNSLEDWCVQLISEAWNVPPGEISEQVKAHNAIANEYSLERTRKGIPYVDPRHNPDYPLREEVGHMPNGDILMDNIILLKRPARAL